MNLRAFVPELLISGARTQKNLALNVRDGVVVSMGEPLPGAELIRLKDAAILPGLVTAHSHAFQRAIRGRTEFRNHPIDDFWSWREAMYAAVESLTPEEIFAVSKMCFLEMARAGITCVGEFHYLHRDPQGRAYADPNELDKLVIQAAREVGLRVVHLRVAYARAGFQRPENPRQRRFIEGSADEFLINLENLGNSIKKDPLISVGAAPHSVRACPADWIEVIAKEATRNGWPLHLHVSEQPAEVAQCRAEHGLTPPRLLEKLGALSERMTAVHAVHLEPDDIAALANAGACVCACPTTERNLGDGIVPADRLLAAGVRLCVGSDSEVQLSPLEDVRQLEYHLRLQTLQRAVLDPGGGRLDGLGSRLYSIASQGGMHALGLTGGSLNPGEPADFIVADLNDPSIAGSNTDALLATAVFSMERTAIRDVYVAGEAIVRDGRTGQEARVLPAFNAAMKRLWQ